MHNLKVAQNDMFVMSRRCNIFGAKVILSIIFDTVFKWNVTPLLLGGSNFYFFTDLYCARIGLNARFALPTKEGGKERAFRPIRVQYSL